MRLRVDQVELRQEVLHDRLEGCHALPVEVLLELALVLEKVLVGHCRPHRGVLLRHALCLDRHVLEVVD